MVAIKKPDAQVYATSTECTVTFPDLGDLTLVAGVRSPIPATALERVKAFPGVVIESEPIQEAN